MHNVGIIGLGIMGQRMMRAMETHPEFKISHIWDLNADVVNEISNHYPNAVPAESAEALMSSRDVDIVYIATPPKTHISYARMSMTADKGILCEKPLAVDVEESRKLVEDVNKSGVPNAVNFPFASDLNISTLEEDLEEKLHGDIERIEIRFHFNAWPRTWQSRAAGWLDGREQGGFLREVFSHFVYLTQRLVGQLEPLTGSVIFPENSDQSEIYANGYFLVDSTPVLMHGAVGGAAPDFNQWTLYGTERSYRIQDWGELKVANINRWYDLMPRGEPKPPLHHQLDNLAKMLRGEPHTLPSFQEGFRVQEVVEGLLKFES